MICVHLLVLVTSEPIIQESIGDDINTKGLITDSSVRGFWKHQRIALFDTCILNTDAKSLQNQLLKSIFYARKYIKKEKYCAVAESRRATFMQIIASCGAIFDSEAAFKETSYHFVKKKCKSSSSTLLHPSQNADVHNEQGL